MLPRGCATLSEHARFTSVGLRPTKGPKYSSTKRPFTSYCLSLGSGARLTLGELSFRTSLPCRTSLAAHAKRLWYQESTGEFSSCGRSYHSGDVHHLYTAIVLT